MLFVFWMLVLCVLDLVLIGAVITTAWNKTLLPVLKSKTRMGLLGHGVALALDLVAVMFLLAAFFSIPTFAFIGTIVTFLGR